MHLWLAVTVCCPPRSDPPLPPPGQVGEDMFDASACFLNGTEMRPKVSYLMGSGSVLRLLGKCLSGIDPISIKGGLLQLTQEM